MLTQSDLVILARAVLGAGLGFLIGWERQVTGSPIKARTIGLAALTAASPIVRTVIGEPVTCRSQPMRNPRPAARTARARRTRSDCVNMVGLGIAGRAWRAVR